MGKYNMSNYRISYIASNSVLRMTALVLCMFGLQACQNNQMADLKQFVATAYQDKKPEIEPLPEIKPFKGFEYSAAGEEDPFGFKNIGENRNDGLVGGAGSPDRNRRKEPLEDYPLDALKMVGTMTQEQVPWVVVQTTDGKALRATIGNYMGLNDGKITEIVLDEQKVVLAELVLDTAGRWVTREREITIDE